jgi:hypothetical protein
MAVLPLDGKVTHGYNDLADSIYQRILTALFKTKRFELVERAQLATVLGEAKLQHSGLIDDRSAVRLGKQLGVDTVVVGSYVILVGSRYIGNGTTVYSANVDLNIRFVDVRTGRVGNLVKASVDGNLENIMDRLSGKLEREISNLYPIKGCVIKVRNAGEAVIDLGARDGVVEGCEFYVIEYGESIVHPKTKEVIQGEKKVVNVLETTTISERTSLVKIKNPESPVKVGSDIESKPKEAGFWEATKEWLKR